MKNANEIGQTVEIISVNVALECLNEKVTYLSRQIEDITSSIAWHEELLQERKDTLAKFVADRQEIIDFIGAMGAKS